LVGSSQNYTPLTTSSPGTIYYYVVVTNTLTNNGDGGTKTATIASNAVGITINPIVNAQQPNITEQPVGATYNLNATATALAVTATSPESGTLTYQWYSNTANNNTSGSIINGATARTYTPPTNSAGTRYYYVIVTNTITNNGDGGTKTNVRTSNQVAVVVNQTYTVTFNSNGGTAVAAITVVSGSTVSRPINPTRTASGANTTRFRNWYTQANFNAGNLSTANAFNFSTPITSNITLVADWGYRIGDTGPGGGIIFYRSETAFTVINFGTTHYLEAAPANMDTTLRLSTVTSPPYPDVTGTATGIGAGRNNTNRILAVEPTAPAALACRNYRGPNNLTDWFLPSRDELLELYLQRVAVGMPSSGSFWSSSQNGTSTGWTQNFTNGNQFATMAKQNVSNVRAVRAF